MHVRTGKASPNCMPKSAGSSVELDCSWVARSLARSSYIKTTGTVAMVARPMHAIATGVQVELWLTEVMVARPMHATATGVQVELTALQSHCSPANTRAAVTAA